MKKFLAALALLAFSAAASARIIIGVGIPAPVYVAPPPVYVQQQTPYYGQPAPVYVQPQPTIVIAPSYGWGYHPYYHPYYGRSYYGRRW